MLRPRTVTSLVALLGAAFLTDSSIAQETEGSCPMTSAPVVFGTGTLDTLVEHKDGVEYYEEGGTGGLRLATAGGMFRSTTVSWIDISSFGAAADFNSDGYDDFVAGDTAGVTAIYKNTSYTRLGSPSDWDDPDYILPPEFFPTSEVTIPTDPDGRYWMVLIAGDFSGDGKPDVIRVNSGAVNNSPGNARIWLNTTPASGPLSFGTPYSPLATGVGAATLGRTGWAGTNVAVVDYNNDRKLDFLIGSADGTGGTIRIFLNNCPSPASPPPPPALIPCASDPKFTLGGDLIANMNMGEDATGGELPVFAFADFDGDGLRDLIAGSPLCCAAPGDRLRMWRGLSGGGIEAAASQSIPFVGAATVVVAADFSRDGRLDLVVATEGSKYGALTNIGGQAFYYVNNGTATPFSDGPKAQLTDYLDPNADYDTGFALDYDKDPSQTPDVVLLDNDSSRYVVLANRAVTTYVPCGEVASGVLDLGPLASSEMVINAARMSPNVELNGGTVNWFMSNEEPPNWVAAVDCGDGTGGVCATFPRPVGREVRWKAEICSNTFRTRTPVIHGIEIRFDYTEAQQHLRSGVVISDGVAYVGSFSQPGDRGRLYALNTGLTRVYWEFGAKLDAMSDSARMIYTGPPPSMTPPPPDGSDPIEFRVPGSSDADLVSVMGTADSAQAQDVIEWVRSARFGVGNAGIDPTKLGAIELSTPAVVNKPGLPLWYTLASAADRSAVDSFVSTYANRVPFILFGSRDGMIHAVRNVATDIEDTANGTEAWAFVPRNIASRMLADYTASLSGTLTVTAYPDGPPTVDDVKLGGAMRTVAVIGSGSGGESVTALNITETVDPMSTAVYGPKLLWEAIPGGADAGQAYAKPVIARVSIGGSERFITIAGTGTSFDNVTPPYTKGRIVVAYDIETGSELWKFQAACPLTSHITVFESDDEGEPGAPTVDGFMDRVVFADRCGYVYKLDPAKDLGGDWNDNGGLVPSGTQIEVGAIAGKSFYAMFSTMNDDSIGTDQQRPIVGTVGARSDATGDMVLYFGTGGLEDYDPAMRNAFYAVYAKNGVVRNQITGDCSAGRCEKFYGGVVVTSEQVIYTRSIDRRVGTGICDNGTTKVQLSSLEPDGTPTTVDMPGAAVGSVYGDAGAIYFATMSGEIVRIGEPRVTEAGGDTAAGDTGGLSGALDNAPLVLMGWRQIF